MFWRKDKPVEDVPAERPEGDGWVRVADDDVRVADAEVWVYRKPEVRPSEAVAFLAANVWDTVVEEGVIPTALELHLADGAAPPEVFHDVAGLARLLASAVGPDQ